MIWRITNGSLSWSSGKAVHEYSTHRSRSGRQTSWGPGSGRESYRNSLSHEMGFSMVRANIRSQSGISQRKKLKAVQRGLEDLQ